MEGSQVVELGDKWIFQPRDSSLDDLVFDTELEACAAQQGYRLAIFCDPMTGEEL